MKTKFLGALVASIFSSVHAFAITIETGVNFISSPTYFNGFEGNNGSNTVFVPPDTESYSEGGITVSTNGVTKLGSPVADYHAHWGPSGQYQWYAPVPGYSFIKLTGGGNFQSLQFLASSGWVGVTNTFLQYQILEFGLPIASGTLTLDATLDKHSWEYVGFSGGGFDEVRLQAISTFSDFNPNINLQSIALDNISAIGEVNFQTPLPAALPLFATGLGVLGLLGWRRKRKARAGA